MMSLSGLRQNLFKTFDFMKGTHSVIEIYHRRKVYRLHIEQTGERITTKYKKRTSSSIPNALLKSKDCSVCGDLIVNDLCMNRDCPTYS